MSMTVMPGWLKLGNRKASASETADQNGRPRMMAKSSQEDKGSVLGLVEQLRSLVNGSEPLDKSSANEALVLSRRLVQKLENPVMSNYERSSGHNVTACLKIASDLGVFRILAEEPNNGKTVEELATRTQADPLLIARLMRLFVAADLVEEIGQSKYKATTKGVAASRDTFIRGLQHMYNANFEIALRAPDAFKTNGYENPTIASQTPFQYARNTTDSYFEWMQKRPEVAANFDAFMTEIRLTRESWIDWFPVQEHLLDGAKQDADSPFMVDIGGGQGRDLVDFRSRFPSAQGRYILQDQQHAIDRADVSGVEKMTHDFSNPQPVKGARIYFTHYIIHNWDDEKAALILQQIAGSMEKGYSKVLLNEWILPDEGCTMFEALIDVQMMFAMAGMERTESQWRSLLEKAGLKLVKFWLPEGKGEGVVEAELA